MRHGRTATKPDRSRTNCGFSSNRTFTAGIVKSARVRIPNVVLGLACSSSHSKYDYSVPTIGSKQSHSCCCGFSFPGNSKETDILGRKMGRQYYSAANHPQTGVELIEIPCSVQLGGLPVFEPKATSKSHNTRRTSTLYHVSCKVSSGRDSSLIEIRQRCNMKMATRKQA